MQNEKIVNAVIIEDEPKNVALLKKMLQMYCPQINVCGDANSIEDAVKLIRNSKPDLVFLDIEIGGGNAFNLLDILKPIKFDIIFVLNVDRLRLSTCNLIIYL